jgi:hypothetical protein
MTDQAELVNHSLPVLGCVVAADARAAGLALSS